MAFSFAGFDWDKLFSSSLGIFIVFALICFIIVIVLAVYWVFFSSRKYKQFLCVIYSKDGYGNRTIEYDGAGIFIDKKTNNKRFFMKVANVGLCPDNIPAIFDGKRKVVFLQKIGLKNYRFIKIGFNAENDIPVLECTEEDVNWGVNAYERQKKFNNNTLMALLPYIALIIVAIVIMVVFIYFFKDFDKLKEMGIALQKATENLIQIQNTTMTYELSKQAPNYVSSGVMP